VPFSERDALAKMAELSNAADSRTSRSILESRFREPLIAAVRQQEAQSQSQSRVAR
jgi:hypothetical protein